jgi:Zn-dependent protease
VDSALSRCPECGAEQAPGLLSCPSCGRLVHAATLKKLAADAEAAEKAGDLSTALTAWRDTLELLPPNTRQHAVILQRIQTLSARVDEGVAAAPAGSALKRGAAGLGGLALLLYKFKAIILIALTKGKFLLMGLTKLPTLLSMLAWVGIYWSLWGWKFALGMGVSIYIHEMGHVWMLRRFGIRATAPMFIPGFGALVRLQQHPTTVVEDSRIGLAGPFWGLGAAAASFGLRYATDNEFWGALAQFGAMINLFNLIPIWQLDGGRGFSSLTKGQRGLAALASFGMYYFTGEIAGHHAAHQQNVFLLIIGLCGAGRALFGDAPKQRDDFGLFQYVLLIMTLGFLAGIDLDVHAR